MKNKGFSLIEVLVVVAIIGVLAGVGGFAYTNFLSGTQDSTTLNTAQDVNRALETQLEAISLGVTAGSFDVSNPTTAECSEWVASVVTQLNTDFENAANPDLPYAVNGHTMASAASGIARGQVAFHCPNPTAQVGADGFGIYQCACTKAEGCEFDSGEDAACPAPVRVQTQADS